MSYQLPENFFFGGSMSGPQTEGKWQDGGKLPGAEGKEKMVTIHRVFQKKQKDGIKSGCIS